MRVVANFRFVRSDSDRVTSLTTLRKMRNVTKMTTNFRSRRWSIIFLHRLTRVGKMSRLLAGVLPRPSVDGYFFFAVLNSQEFEALVSSTL